MHILDNRGCRCGKSSAYDVNMGVPPYAVSMEEGNSIHWQNAVKLHFLKFKGTWMEGA